MMIVIIIDCKDDDDDADDADDVDDAGGEGKGNFSSKVCFVAGIFLGAKNKNKNEIIFSAELDGKFIVAMKLQLNGSQSNPIQCNAMQCNSMQSPMKFEIY